MNAITYFLEKNINQSIFLIVFLTLIIAPGTLFLIFYRPDVFWNANPLNILLFSTALSLPVFLFELLVSYAFLEKSYRKNFYEVLKKKEDSDSIRVQETKATKNFIGFVIALSAFGWPGFLFFYKCFINLFPFQGNNATEIFLYAILAKGLSTVSVVFLLSFLVTMGERKKAKKNADIK